MGFRGGSVGVRWGFRGGSVGVRWGFRGVLEDGEPTIMHWDISVII